MAKKVEEKEGPKCPITRKQFQEDAPPSVAVVINGSLQAANKKEFSTGSLGFYCGDKVTLIIDGVPVKCSVSCSIVIVGSKEAD